MKQDRQISMKHRSTPKEGADQFVCGLLWKTVALPFAPVDFHRKPEPVPHTQVLPW